MYYKDVSGGRYKEWDVPGKPREWPHDENLTEKVEKNNYSKLPYKPPMRQTVPDCLSELSCRQNIPQSHNKSPPGNLPHQLPLIDFMFFVNPCHQHDD